MRILKTQTTEEESINAISESSYDILAISEFQDLCRQINLICMDNDRFPILLDQSIDSLSSLKEFLNRVHEEKQASYRITSFSDTRFAYMQNETLKSIPNELEDINIYELINSLSLESKLKNKILKLYLIKSSGEEGDFLQSLEDSLVFHVHVHYSNKAFHFEKLIIIRKNPHPEILILSKNGFIEDHIKLRNLIFSDENETSLRFKNSLDTSENITKSVNFKVNFLSPESKNQFFKYLEEVLSIFNRKMVPDSPNLQLGKKYHVKKTNRFGINQKRVVWLDAPSLTFHISEEKEANEKKFKLSEIRTYIRTSKPCKIIVDFFNQKQKKLCLMFGSPAELQEFLQASEEINKTEVIARTTVNLEVAASQAYEENLRSRRFSWLGSKKNQIISPDSPHELTYTVVQKGRISHEKRSIVLNTESKQLTIKNQAGNAIKTLNIHDIKLEDSFKNLFKLQLFAYNSCSTLIFPSSFLRYHFTSNFLLAKHPIKVRPQENPVNEFIKVYAMTWNLGCNSEPGVGTIGSLLSSSFNHQIVALTFQQCKEGQVQAWIKAIEIFYCNFEMHLIASVSREDMFLAIFVHTSLKYHITNIKSAVTIFTKILAETRKSGLAVRFKVESTSFCFLAGHLPSNHRKVQERNKCIEKILDFKSKLSDLEPTQECDYVFLLGDLCYPIEMEKEQISEKIEDLETLRQRDLLRIQIAKNAVLSVFQEGLLGFPPTYPVLKTEENLSWFDRILYKDNYHCQLLEYSSIADCFKSNHRAVHASFNLKLRSWFYPVNLNLSIENPALICVKFKSLTVSFNADVEASKFLLSFYSPYLHSYPSSLQGNKSAHTDSFEFVIEKGYKVLFYHLSSQFLADKRLIFVLKKWKESFTDVYATAGLMMHELVQNIGPSENDFKAFVANKAKKMIPFEATLESRSKVVGKIHGVWRFKVLTVKA